MLEGVSADGQIFLPVCFYCLVTLRQRLWFVIWLWRYINLFVCMYVCISDWE